MAIIVAEEDTLVKEILKKSSKTGKIEPALLLTLKPGVVVKCPRCGHPMIRYGVTYYEKHIEDIHCGNPTKLFHLQILTCPNKVNCRDMAESKDPQVKKNKATHVLLPEFACPLLRVQADVAEDLVKARNEIKHLQKQFKHTKLSQQRIDFYCTQSEPLKQLKRQCVNFKYFLVKALGSIGKHLSMPVKKVLSIARSVFDTYSLNFNNAPVKTRGKPFDTRGKSNFRIFGVYCCSRFVNDSPIHLKRSWVFSCNKMITIEPNNSS